MKKVLLVALCFLLTGCGTTALYQQTIASWQGAHVNQLVHKWGYPDKTRRAPDGNRLLIYRQVDRGRNPIVAIPGSTTVVQENGRTVFQTTPTTYTGGGSYDFRCTTWFEVNRRNIIVNTAMRGNSCLADKSFAERMSHY